jgi:hypothetical protein
MRIKGETAVAIPVPDLLPLQRPGDVGTSAAMPRFISEKFMRNRERKYEIL